MENIKLTQFSPGAGCGCKIAPKELEKILESSRCQILDPNLIVGNDTKDDAAVLDLGNGTALISTTDFFTPIVDDAFDFGRIAATNAISDIYAMGGQPVLALAILAWPLDKLPTEMAKQVIEGAREVCTKAGIRMAGGHSINISDPVFGLAVNGIVNKEYIKQNNMAVANADIYLTKPLGIGLCTTAEKKGLRTKEQNKEVVELMCELNTIGIDLGKMDQVKSLTDVTGFGLLGHLSEICEGSNISANIKFSSIPKISGVDELIAAKSMPGGTSRNWNSYGHLIADISEDQKALLCDPQTSGGLLAVVEKSGSKEFEQVCAEKGTKVFKIGETANYESGKYIFIED
ncbi:MAG: selenide, water dikinase SelD [Marinifilaceae bacterium]|jgi:selenide,water dikinase|nr:selenide, water dikinase SelD [Marinifilaceae bacterium]